MVKVFGVILMITGSTGFAACLCKEQRIQLFLLKEMKHMFQIIQEDIRYSGLPVFQIIKRTAGKIKEPYAKALEEISKALLKNNGEMLGEVWEREMNQVLGKHLLTEAQRKLLLEFPQSLGLWEREGQAKALTCYIEELEKWIMQTEKEEKDKNKVIMSLGTAGGILLSVLLL